MSEYAFDTDNGKKDSNGNGCAWYDVNARNEEYFTDRWQYDNCDSFNTEDFNARELCVACYGGFKFGMDCLNEKNLTNSFGKTCDDMEWYTDWERPE